MCSHLTNTTNLSLNGSPIKDQTEPSPPTLAGDLLSVSYRDVAELKPYANNARMHSKAQIRKISQSIRAFGFTNPILIDAKDTIIAGHGRVQAAKLLNMEQVPTIRLETLTDEQVRIYIIADNKLAETEWDQEILKIELQHLMLVNEVDISLTGFEIPEIDLIIGVDVADDGVEDEIVEQGVLVSGVGDLWELGGHRILCGSALERNSFEALLGGARADVVFVDPPYNVQIDGNVSGKGSIKHKDFAMASGEMSSSEFTSFLTTGLELLSQNSVEGSVHFVCQDWRHMSELLAAGSAAYETLLNLCIWSKDNGGQGSFYRSKHELVFVFRKGSATHRNNIQLGRYGRYRTNVWEYPAVRGLSQQQDEEGNLLALHPTVKPVALIADAILDCSKPGDIVLDSFLGSGSTVIAAERTGRRCYGIELEPRYVDTAIRRWQKYTGQDAVRVPDGQTFRECEDKVAGHA